MKIFLLIMIYVQSDVVLQYRYEMPSIEACTTAVRESTLSPGSINHSKAWALRLCVNGEGQRWQGGKWLVDPVMAVQQP